jgi:hypothetical protein
MAENPYFKSSPDVNQATDARKPANRHSRNGLPVVRGPTQRLRAGRHQPCPANWSRADTRLLAGNLTPVDT